MAGLPSCGSDARIVLVFLKSKSNVFVTVPGVVLSLISDAST